MAFGEGYEILDDRAPVLLPVAAWEAVLNGYSGSMSTAGTAGGEVELPAYCPPDADAVAMIPEQ